MSNDEIPPHNLDGIFEPHEMPKQDPETGEYILTEQQYQKLVLAESRGELEVIDLNEVEGDV